MVICETNDTLKQTHAIFVGVTIQYQSVVACDMTVVHHRQVVVVSCVALNFIDSCISWCYIVFNFSIFCFAYIFRDDFWIKC